MSTSPARSTIDLVADLGEGFGPWTMGDDEALLRIVTSANIACGFHAGDPRIMERTVARCLANGVAVGAHPGYPDLAGFGRRELSLSPDEIRTDTMYQLGALAAFATAQATTVHHLTVHGRLGNRVVVDAGAADAVATAVQAVDPRVIVYAQPGELVRAARQRSLDVAVIGFTDRAYEADGTLRDRRLPGAVLTDADEIAERAVLMATTGQIVAADMTTIMPPAGDRIDTILVHGDTDDAVNTARAVRSALEAAGVEVASVGSPPRSPAGR